MSIFITLGDFFYKIGGKNPGEHESYEQTQPLTPSRNGTYPGSCQQLDT